jgi:hypothetical protein
MTSESSCQIRHIVPGPSRKVLVRPRAPRLWPLAAGHLSDRKLSPHILATADGLDHRSRTASCYRWTNAGISSALADADRPRFQFLILLVRQIADHGNDDEALQVDAGSCGRSSLKIWGTMCCTRGAC